MEGEREGEGEMEGREKPSAERRSDQLSWRIEEESIVAPEPSTMMSVFGSAQTHEDTSPTMARVAGERMIAQEPAFAPIPARFVSELKVSESEVIASSNCDAINRGAGIGMTV